VCRADLLGEVETRVERGGDVAARRSASFCRASLNWLKRDQPAAPRRAATGADMIAVRKRAEKPCF
jgi:hypothetical protein